MEDCIHLKACRRVQKLAREQGCRFARMCHENCSAYVSRDDETRYVTVKEAVGYAQDGADSIRSGYSEYDVYVTWDLITSKTLLQLLRGD